jgi:hypothetical protein
MTTPISQPPNPQLTNVTAVSSPTLGPPLNTV